MSSINPHYTFHYSQPAEYRFSHDSVFLARRVFELLASEDLSQLRGLDLCSGCGIIGLDFLFHCDRELQKSLHSFDFIEVQDIYRNHFEKNCEQVGDIKTHLRFKNINYAELTQKNFENRYDLILCNPPYFQKGQGKLSPSAFKNRCRFFVDADFYSLINGIENSLNSSGRAFVLLRDLQDHGFSYFEEARKVLSRGLKIEKIGDIRGTDLVVISQMSDL